jgi:hypothetical protein
MDFEAYCVKCREKRDVKDGEVKDTPNGRRMAQGKCPVCGTTVTRFLAAEGAGAGSKSGKSEGKGSKSDAKAEKAK